VKERDGLTDRVVEVVFTTDVTDVVVVVDAGMERQLHAEDKRAPDVYVEKQDGLGLAA